MFYIERRNIDRREAPGPWLRSEIRTFSDKETASYMLELLRNFQPSSGALAEFQLISEGV